MAQVLLKAKTDAVLAASILHFGECTVRDVEEFLAKKDIPVRLRDVYMNCCLRVWLARLSAFVLCFFAWQQPASAQINLSLLWTYTSTNETGFGVQRTTSTNGTWTQVGTVAAPATAYLDMGLQYSTTYYYRVWAYNAAGDSPYSSMVSFTTPASPATNTAPKILTQPASQTVNVGDNVTFSVGASGTPPLTYQWLFNGGNLSGQTASTLNLSQIQQGQAGNYWVVVSNVAGTATSATAVLTVVVPVTNTVPKILTQPSSHTVNIGSNVTFSVTASGTAPMTYHWLFNGGNLTGQTASTLNLSQVQQGQAGNYWVVVSNVAGTATSATAVLTVTVLSPDAVKPKLSIVTPKANEKWSSAAFTVSGKASDNAGVANVYYSLNGSGWASASTANGWANWTANVTLTPGTNTIQAYAADNSGNVSATNTVRFMHVLKSVLTVHSTVGGKISPNYNGKLLQIGESYSMTAKAEKGFAFTNWTGSVTNNGTTLEFTMASNLTFTANFVDIAPPTLSIESPKSRQRLDSSVFTVTGRARDNVAVAGVYYSLNGSGWASASTADGWAKWMANVTLTSPGTNTIQAYAVDTSGHLSATDSVSFVYVMTAPLTVLINGSGKVSPDYNGKLLQIGENYAMTAKPGSGVTFVNWTGSATTTSATLEFTMTSNLTFTANFSNAVSPAVQPQLMRSATSQSELSKSESSVQILPPDISDISVDQGMATISFDSQTNLLYTLESKDSLADTNWTALPVSIIGTGDTISLTDSNAPPVCRFYRVHAQAAP
jgi:uncharacterized repeat protein (TIGR02543 family)